jgi:3-deoxy-D-manno-octulosonic-acid transferase
MMLDCFDFCLMQSELDRERVLKLGVDEGRVITAGNIKFDREQVPMRSEERGAWMDALHLKPEEPLWVAGSTHEGEEEILLDALSDLRTVFPGMRLIIAPRKIERAEFIRNLANQRGFKTRLKTGLAGGDGGYDVLILDTIGELGRIYGIARISFVGGSLVPVGGHNLLEPAGFGRPVLFGPHMHNFVLMSQLLEESGGGQMVRDRGELVEAMKDLLCHPDKMTHMGEKAMDFVEINRGALARVMACIGPYL